VTYLDRQQEYAMRKRLRRKKHLGEFRQFGFSVACRFRKGLSREEFDRFVDDFIADAIEAGPIGVRCRRFSRSGLEWHRLLQPSVRFHH
jgi:uncharacterized protein YggL (DUF469 family)